MKSLYLLVVGVLMGPFAYSQTPSDFVCKPGNLPDECAAFKVMHDKRVAEKEAQQLSRQKSLDAEAARQQAALEEKQRKEAQWAAERAQRQAEDDARQAAYKKQSEADDRMYAAAERKVAADAAALKTKCGDDYKKPSIGMTMSRVRECVSSSFKEVGQTNTAQGVVTTYRAPGGYLHVIEGKVVQWGKF